MQSESRTADRFGILPVTALLLLPEDGKKTRPFADGSDDGSNADTSRPYNRKSNAKCPYKYFLKGVELIRL